jgi:hypothetical protein
MIVNEAGVESPFLMKDDPVVTLSEKKPKVVKIKSKKSAD